MVFLLNVLLDVGFPGNCSRNILFVFLIWLANGQCRKKHKEINKNGFSSVRMTQELNIGGSLVTSALEDACGTSRSKIREMYNELGDLGRTGPFFS